MFGPFRSSPALSSGLLWKIPFRLSPSQKLRHRRRLKQVDRVVDIVEAALLGAPPPPPVGSQPHSAVTASISPSATTSISAAVVSTPVRPAAAIATTRAATPTEAGVAAASAAASGSANAGKTIAAIARWRAEMPTEAEMLPRDKYTMFDRKVRGYRKGVHKLPKWTRVSQRVNPPGF